MHRKAAERLQFSLSLHLQTITNGVLFSALYSTVTSVVLKKPFISTPSVSYTRIKLSVFHQDSNLGPLENLFCTNAPVQAKRASQI